LAVNELHDQEMAHLSLIRIVGHHDVWMSKTGDRLDLALETLHKESFLARLLESTLRATMRFMRRWRALKTVPIPPAPRPVEHVVIADPQLRMPVLVQGFCLIGRQSS